MRLSGACGPPRTKMQDGGFDLRPGVAGIFPAYILLEAYATSSEKKH